MILIAADFNHRDGRGRLLLSDLAIHTATPFATIAANASILFVQGEDVVTGRLVSDPERGWVGEVDWDTQDLLEEYPAGVLRGRLHGTTRADATRLTGRVAALIADLLEWWAASLRAAGEDAHANLTDPDGANPVVSLEVARDGGDWQRNLAVSLGAVPDATSVDVRISNEDRTTVALVGSATVPPEELGTVALIYARTGVTRLMTEIATSTESVRAARKGRLVRAAIVVDVSVTDGLITFVLADGRRLSAPTSWSDRLRNATPEERNHFEIEPGGLIVAWPDVDEHIGVWTLLGVTEDEALEGATGVTN